MDVQVDVIDVDAIEEETVPNNAPGASFIRPNPRNDVVEGSSTLLSEEDSRGDVPVGRNMSELYPSLLVGNEGRGRLFGAESLQHLSNWEVLPRAPRPFSSGFFKTEKREEQFDIHAGSLEFIRRYIP